MSNKELKTMIKNGVFLGNIPRKAPVPVSGCTSVGFTFMYVRGLTAFGIFDVSQIIVRAHLLLKSSDVQKVMFLVI